MITNRGFTLIEILIVIVIIGITAGFALISFGDFGESRRVLFSADQLVNTLKLAQQKAILETSTLGLRIDNTSYQILRFRNISGWEPISNKGVFKVNYFPKNTFITLKTNNKPHPGAPPIIINSSGDMTPFTLGFGTNKDIIITLRGTHNGNLSFSTANPK
ncbi:type II secretory pathway protein LspH [Legionella antarctica]|uniref:Type II secretion system protein H n=1 Tax=Legionella antarctica TaxID=2708020 RepID=A0A6F8T5J7_9GAMM|nr:type II secretion system minor pseudopilin GspH [Legionella antarctica]BCA95302.1 type II secretory pathway protein LspH [Legionella antarctica]